MPTRSLPGTPSGPRQQTGIRTRITATARTEPCPEHRAGSPPGALPEPAAGHRNHNPAQRAPVTRTHRPPAAASRPPAATSATARRKRSRHPPLRGPQREHTLRRTAANPGRRDEQPAEHGGRTAGHPPHQAHPPPHSSKSSDPDMDTCASAEGAHRHPPSWHCEPPRTAATTRPSGGSPPGPWRRPAGPDQPGRASPGKALDTGAASEPEDAGAYRPGSPSMIASSLVRPRC